MIERQKIPIQLLDNKTIEGWSPLILIGPNGSGKTRYGIDLSRKNNADFVPALRNIALGKNIPMLGLEQAKAELDKNLGHRHYWQLALEINNLFSKLLAEHTISAMDLREKYMAGHQINVEMTKLEHLCNFWHKLFPGRRIDFYTYTPLVTSKLTGDQAQYPAEQLSDGERVALYLSARVLNATPGVIVIDEPEVHLHSRLAVRFWNELESLRPDLRFVYITHDLGFALSRSSAKFLILRRPDETPQYVSSVSDIPPDLSEALLGAASFSIYADRIVFCEGREGDRRDYSLYSSWFDATDTAVIPVGSCRNVINCVKAYSNSSLVRGVKAMGIIDRDYWPDTFLSSLPDNVLVLPVHEVENLYCLRGVFLAVAEHMSTPAEKAREKYEDFLKKVRSLYTGNLFKKQISERFKMRCEGEFKNLFKKINITDDHVTLRSEHIKALRPENWCFNPEQIFDDETELLKQALNGTEEDLFKYFPGKPMIKHAAKILRLEVDGYRSLVDSMLIANEPSYFQTKLVQALESILPSRRT